MPIRAFCLFLFSRLKGFSKSNALGLFIGLLGGLILYWLDLHQTIDLYKTADFILSIACSLGIECIAETTNAAADRTATVNAFIGIFSLGLSWITTELYEAFLKTHPNSQLQVLEDKAKKLEDSLRLPIPSDEHKIIADKEPTSNGSS